MAKCETEAQGKPIEFRPRAELEGIERILSERRELAVNAARLAPPAYVAKELGKRPTDPEKRRSWEVGIRTMRAIVRSTPSRTATTLSAATLIPAEAPGEPASRRSNGCGKSQRELGKLKGAARTRDMDFSLGIGR